MHTPTGRNHQSATVKPLRRVSLFLALAGAATVASLTSAPAASAAVNHNVNYSQACKDTYNDGYAVARSTASWQSPLSNYCVHVHAGSPFNNWILGGANVQQYCSIAFPGSRAVVINWNSTDGWKCQS